MNGVDAMLVAAERVSGEPLTVVLYGIVRGRAPSLERLRRLVAERWGHLGRLRLRFPTAHGAVMRPYSWVLGGDCPSSQVHEWRESSSVRFQDLLAAEMASGFPRRSASALWNLFLVPRVEEDAYALVLSAHHALLDGYSLVCLFRLLCDGPASLSPDEVRPDALQPPLPRAGAPAVAHALLALARRCRDVTLAGGDRTASPVPVSGPRTARAVERVEISRAAMDAARGRRGPDGRRPFTVTEVYIAAVAHALAEQRAAARGRVGIAVPVDLRSPAEAPVLGNRVSAVRVQVRMGRSALPDVLADVAGGLRHNRARRRALGGAVALEAVAGFASRSVDLVARGLCLPSTAALTCSSLRCLEEDMELDGQPVTRVAGFGPLPPGQQVYTVLCTNADAHVLCLVSRADLAPVLPELGRAVGRHILSLGHDMKAG
ncbi:WS/DGAT domain-containing protein [Streptomyces sp. NPDC052676]|uniref:WS/DGAT domain-containing protein n=1 Tax=Streptomyces sp. NPDC052676 TaxID=3154953 RepID=UPI00344558BA